jgi:hypothetical protein
MRSAKPPITSAGVMMAKVSWNRAAARVRRHPRHEDLAQAADERAAGAEAEAIKPDHPQQRDDAGDGKALHQHRQHVLGAHQSAVEQRESRQRHEQHQRGGAEQPGGVAAIDAVVGERAERRQAH